MKKYYDNDNIVIYNCDNLDLLKEIESESVNLIYCDILYNTGKCFDDYNDNLGSSKDAIEWYRPRIVEMKRILKNNGSIFLHCNWRLDSYMRILMDEIFTSECFRNRIYRKHSNERGFYKNFDSQVDVILYYVKDKNNFVFNEIYNEEVKITPVFENGFIENMSEDISFGDNYINLKEQNKHLIINKQKLINLYQRGEIVLIDGLPYRKTYAMPIGNLWDDDDMLDNYSRNKIADTYDTPKPLAVIERIITTCSNEGDVIADFFLGGGSTAVVCKKLNRKGIFCDINKKACDVTIEKLKNL
ncbi:MAG: DNA methyltransferase [Bacilli bacterium]